MTAVRVPLTECPNCGHAGFARFGETHKADALHELQSRCLACGLVFANPRCDRATLDAYYTSAFYEREWPDMLREDPVSVQAEKSRRAEEVARVRRLVPGGRALEIGASTGAFLVQLRDVGFEPYGVEPSRAAVDHGRRVHGLELIPGTFEDAALPEASFDLIYAWHVIEHVVDLDRFVRKAVALLRPGGVLYLGTETWQNAGWAADRLVCALRGRPAPYATSPEHTFVFTRATLADVLMRRGLHMISCEAYQPSWREKMRTMRFRHPLSFGWYAAQHLSNRVLSTGPLLRAAARKP